MSFLRKIEGEINFHKKYTFCTLVTRPNEYKEMVLSAEQKGFSAHDVEFLFFDNKASNQFDGFSGINRAIKEAQGEYLIFCHQDILFKYDDREILEERIKELNKLNPKWAIAGNAGRKTTGKHVVRISDPHGENIADGPFPQEVMSVDENFFIINQKVNIAATTILKGFHLYGLDLCQNASFLGLKSYVIDFHLFHKSAGNVDKSYYVVQNEYIKVQQNRKISQWFFPMCSIFFISSSNFLNFIINQKKIKKLILNLFIKKD
ncbi:glycosyltransferase family 2 protein [Acinetobacter sp. MB5]|uniref:glycosyltransferase family 2 protein n=1 Tax=Acinetobacter sp. MB5 TaxID=2069438 RepID=UPI001D0DA117|nr:acyl esterase [Acinetobacter sp. MB5]